MCSKKNGFITKEYKGQTEETPIGQIWDNSSIKRVSTVTDYKLE